MKIPMLIAAFALAMVAPAAAKNRVVTIVNSTSYDIVDFYAANRDDGKWGGTFLGGSKILRPNFELDVDIDDGSGYCVFDFLAVFEDGVETRKNGINVCELEVFYFTQQ